MGFIDDDILALLRQRGRRWPITIEDLAARTAHSPTDTYFYVEELRRRGLIEQASDGRVRTAEVAGGLRRAAS